MTLDEYKAKIEELKDEYREKKRKIASEYVKTINEARKGDIVCSKYQQVRVERTIWYFSEGIPVIEYHGALFRKNLKQKKTGEYGSIKQRDVIKIIKHDAVF